MKVIKQYYYPKHSLKFYLFDDGKMISRRKEFHKDILQPRGVLKTNFQARLKAITDFHKTPLKTQQRLTHVMWGWKLY